MSAEKIGIRYAKALFDEAQKSTSLDTIQQDLSLLNNTLKSSKDLRVLFESPVVKSFKKSAIVNQIFSGKVNPLTEKFLQIVVQQGREKYFTNIIAAFFKMYNDKNGISEVTVTTATELDIDSENKIADYIKKTSGYPNVKINKKIDNQILGGFIIDFGGKLYDNSVLYKLNKIKKEISN